MAGGAGTETREGVEEGGPEGMRVVGCGARAGGAGGEDSAWAAELYGSVPYGSVPWGCAHSRSRDTVSSKFKPAHCSSLRIPSPPHPFPPASLTVQRALLLPPERPLLFGDTHPTAHLGAEWLRNLDGGGHREDPKLTPPAWGGQRPQQTDSEHQGSFK